MIRIQQRLFEALEQGGKQAVLCALQDALRLEHATIPPYLYALCSLDDAKNGGIADIIRTVVVEEMLHMALVCNIINALGDGPQIDNPALLPQYPGPLPGGVESDLCVHLAPFSAEQLAAFLKIEEPENPLEFPSLLAAGERLPKTIGQYYAEIKEQIGKLSEGSFVSSPRHQIGPDLLRHAIIVTDAKSANDAIDLIVEQGEGTDKSPGEVVGRDFAHFYRFNQIAKGKQLVPNPQAPPDAPPEQKYSYTGPAITLDPSGVAAAPRDPKASNYPVGSEARRAVDSFNAAYTGLLKELQLLFNGAPELYKHAKSTMDALGNQAKNLMTTDAPEGGKLGPTFEYYVGNPG
jgi:hypothetical protein